MKKDRIFHFRTDLSKVEIPKKLNNPFGLEISEIAKIAAKEFQEFIDKKSSMWGYDFKVRDGKMFGILVVQKEDGNFAYLGTNSGKLPETKAYENLIPSIFDDSTDDFFFSKGMISLTEIGKKIKESSSESEVKELTNKRRLRSISIQKKLFENYIFINVIGHRKNALQIFEKAIQGKPPSAAGECAAPKLLQYALQHKLKPIALTEFWWGNPLKNKERVHKHFYPACKDKCRPILEFMLDDKELYQHAHLESN